MDRETRAKIDNFTSSYEYRIGVLFSLIALVFFLAASVFTIYFFTREAYDPTKGDKPLITYQVEYHGQQYTQVAAWVDKDGNARYVKRPPRFAGIDLIIPVLALLGLGIAKGSCDLCDMLFNR